MCKGSKGKLGWGKWKGVWREQRSFTAIICWHKLEKVSNYFSLQDRKLKYNLLHEHFPTLSHTRWSDQPKVSDCSECPLSLDVLRGTWGETQLPLVTVGQEEMEIKPGELCFLKGASCYTDARSVWGVLVPLRCPSLAYHVCVLLVPRYSIEK